LEEQKKSLYNQKLSPVVCLLGKYQTPPFEQKCRVSVIFPAEILSDKAETWQSACLGCMQNSKVVPIFVL
jgi:hypothetical protein